jgi:large subunit ribosomal protein L31
MKKDIHPEYKFVVFKDVSTGFEVLTRSTLTPKATTTHQGEEVGLVTADVTSDSHPFYTGTQKIMDTEGRVERFRKKYGFAEANEAGSNGATEPEPKG